MRAVRRGVPPRKRFVFVEECAALLPSRVFLFKFARRKRGHHPSQAPMKGAKKRGRDADETFLTVVAIVAQVPV